MSALEISIIVPCEGREELVERLLGSLIICKASINESVEIIVVDSSVGAAREALEVCCRRYGARYIHGDRHVGRKRNQGARAASGRYLFFVDSDCEARPDILQQHLDSLRSMPHEVAGGSVGVTEFVGTASWVNRLAEASPFTLAFSFARQMPFCAWAMTSNLVVSKEAFERLGGFDENLPFRLDGDDLDFTWRVTLSGLLLKASPEAVVYHARDTWGRARAFASRIWRWGRVEHLLRLKHRALLRRQFPHIVFWAIWFGLISLGLGKPLGVHDIAGIKTLAGLLSVGVVLEQVLTRRRSGAGIWKMVPGLCASSALYRIASWRECVGRRRWLPPFRKLYFDDWHLRFDAETQAVSAWLVILSCALVIGIG